MLFYFIGVKIMKKNEYFKIDDFIVNIKYLWYNKEENIDVCYNFFFLVVYLIFVF